MRESKILKIISYCLIPILILIIGLSIFYEVGKNSLEVKISKAEYFNSDNFLVTYMNEISDAAEYLIYNNDNVQSIEDNNIKICYIEDYENWSYNNGVLKDNYYLIKYKDLAITNTEFTTETDSIEEIKNYINNVGNDKYVNIINGNTESNSELFSKKSIQFFDKFKHTYYSIEEGVVEKEGEQEFLITENGTYEYNPYQYNYEEENGYIRVEEIPIEEHSSHVMNYREPEKEWHNTTINDFEIYTTYKEELVENQRREYLPKLINDLEPYENILMFLTPGAAVLLCLIIIYLIISIGHSKEKEGIDINDLDKIPLEIILTVVGVLICLIIGCYVTTMETEFIKNYNYTTYLYLAEYLVSYILIMMTTVTIIKRIKAKIFIKTSICGKICLWCIKILKKLINFVKEKYISVKNKIRDIISIWPDIFKIIIILGIYFIVSVFLCISLHFFGFIIALCIGGCLLYGLLTEIESYKKIEKNLKSMYEGKEIEKLKEEDFTNYFKPIVVYINDINKGFENAREEGIKSERLKTELITNVSHDIKTPLTSIINYVDLLKKEKIEDEKIKEYIDVLDTKSQRLKKLTEDLVEASKASSGNMKLNIEKINVVELLKQSLGEFEDKFKNKRLEIISNYSDEEIFIKADNKYMYRVIENLFSNISKYAMENSRVYIDVKTNENKVNVAIKNISKERLNITEDELMQRFVRGDKSRTTEGSGLGISISKSLTEIQKGIFKLQIDGDLFKVELEFETL